MIENESDIVVLKPTPTFLSFIDAQLPDLYLPDIRSLRTNRTAYSLPKKHDEEETFYEIERHFLQMFQNEVNRVIGHDVNGLIEASFLDFLCCFKFDVHSNIILMEPSIKHGQQLLCIKPRSVLLKWVESSLSDEQMDTTQVVERVNLSGLTQHATVIVKNFHYPSEIKPFIKHYYQPIFTAEMNRMGVQRQQWPVVDTFQTFRRYFTVDIHTHLIHLTSNVPSS
jgi:hypothetical protein